MTVLVETTIDLVIEGDLLLRFHEANRSQPPQSSQPNGLATASKKMPVFLSVFALAQYVPPAPIISCPLKLCLQRLPVDYGIGRCVCSQHLAIFRPHVSPTYPLCRATLHYPLSSRLFNALFLVYAIIQSSEVRSATLIIYSQNGFSHLPVNVLTTVLPIVISVAELAYVALAWTIYNEFGWKVYKFLGANRQIKKMFAIYQIFQCLVKFDVFFWVGFCVQFTFLVLDSHSLEFYVTCAALPLSIVLLVEGHLAARYENKWMMTSFISGCVGALMYFSYKVWLWALFDTSSL
jgi:hypothetical protein